jgi:hypothetical protein
MSFTDRNRKNSEKSTVKVVEEENDFPFDEVTDVRLGSAHAVSSDESRDQHLLELMRRLVAHVNVRGAEQEVFIEHK